MAVLNECNNGMLDAFQARPSFLGLLSKSQCTMGEDEKALRHTINTNKKKLPQWVIFIVLGGRQCLGV